MDRDGLTSLTSVFSLLILLMKQLLSWQIRERFAYFGQCPIFSGYGCPNCRKRHAATFVPADSDLGFVQRLPRSHFQWQVQISLLIHQCYRPITSSNERGGCSERMYVVFLHSVLLHCCPCLKTKISFNFKYYLNIRALNIRAF